jgi:hypothetical protein
MKKWVKRIKRTGEENIFRQGRGTRYLHNIGGTHITTDIYISSQDVRLDGEYI